MNNFFSLLIPLKDRSEFTDRTLRYLDQIKFPHKIYIADGSKYLMNAKVVKKYQNKLNIIYTKFSYDRDYSFFLKKILTTLNKMKTTNVMLLPNDDFINHKFINELKNKKISNVIISGINLDFKVRNFINYKNHIGKPIRIDLKKKSYHKNLNSNNKLIRLSKLNYFNPWESIFPKKILSKIFGLCVAFGVKNHYEFMWFFKIYSLYYCKCIFINKKLIARQNNTYFSEGNTIQLKNNYSSKERLIEFLKFFRHKCKNKKIIKIIEKTHLETKPNYSLQVKVIQKIVKLKLHISKILSKVAIFNNQTQKTEHNRTYHFIKELFK